jgi:hypothetical protein
MRDGLRSSPFQICSNNIQRLDTSKKPYRSRVIAGIVEMVFSDIAIVNHNFRLDGSEASAPICCFPGNEKSFLS